jgi:preprotein translocase subunit SecF
MYWMKYKYIYFTISGIFLLISIFSLLSWKIRLGVDFTGGSVFNYRFSKEFDNSQIEKVFEDIGVTNIDIETGDGKQFTIKTSAVTQADKSKLEEELKNIDKDIAELSYEVVGPAIGPELIQKTIYALLLSAGVILLWVAYQFRNIRFGLAAVLAMFHDSLVLLGAFSLMGHFWGVEVDFLFVTAMLTILAFSVHDTIVVFDRIREVRKKTSEGISKIADSAVTQTMVRSLNNSFTIIFMLVALVLLGGDSIRWFAVALLIGTISGTYSSPFVAVPLLVTFSDMKKVNLNFIGKYLFKKKGY